MKFSLEGKLAAILLVLLVAAAAATAALAQLLADAELAAAVIVVTGALPTIWLARAAVRPLRRLLRALSGAVASYQDGDFSLSMAVDRDDELGQLLAIHNALGQALRQQRAHLVQRELLLDTVTQNSPVALVLVDAAARVVYANHAARHLLNEGRGLLGEDFGALLAHAPEALRVAANAAGDTLFSADVDGVEEMFHLSQRAFSLQGRAHRLYLVKRLTRELSRQEVATWKKLIRVLSHELNNSLAPIASLAHSGEEFVRRGDRANLAAAFAAIGERAAHLHRFISGYAAFAKLPAPRPERVEWATMIGELVRQQPCRVVGSLPGAPGWFDRAQLEQVLINLLKNAREAGGPTAEIELSVTQTGAEQRIEVRDRGPGMSDSVFAQALLPFYSTKRNGTGIGLALAREITEAHGGQLRLANRESGGLCVSLSLPLPPTTAPQNRRDCNHRRLPPHDPWSDPVA